MDDAAIAPTTRRKPETVKRILEAYMPRTETMAAWGVVARTALAKTAANVRAIARSE